MYKYSEPEILFQNYDKAVEDLRDTGWPICISVDPLIDQDFGNLVVQEDNGYLYVNELNWSVNGLDSSGDFFNIKP